MHVRSLDESKFRFARNSVRAYLDEGRQGLAWVTGVMRSSGVPSALLTQMVRDEISRRPISHQGRALEKWIADGQ